MPLYHIEPRLLPKFWSVSAPLLQKAIDLDPESVTIDQVEYSVRVGHTFLLVWEEPSQGITGAATVQFIDYPRARVAHIDLMGGKGIVEERVFNSLKDWMRLQGATTAQCWANGSLVRMYQRMGLENTHQVMRVKL